MAKRSTGDYPEILAILERLKGGKANEIIGVFVPSHDRHNKPLTDQDIWAGQTLDLFGQLFGGATSFNSLSGIYQPKRDLRPLYDAPIMVQSLTATERVESEDNLFELADFCRNMGKKTNQESIGLILNNVFIDVKMVHT